jgi:hypothetical protein
MLETAAIALFVAQFACLAYISFEPGRRYLMILGAILLAATWATLIGALAMDERLIHPAAVIAAGALALFIADFLLRLRFDWFARGIPVLCGAGLFAALAVASVMGEEDVSPYAPLDGEIALIAFDDPNENGRQDPGELILAGFTFQLNGPTSFTAINASPEPQIVAVPSATFTISVVGVPPGRELSDGTENPQTVRILTDGGAAQVLFGSVESPPSLTTAE